MKQEVINTQTANWEVESFDNGMAIANADTLQKEAALYDDINTLDPKSIQHLLGKWLYGEIDHYLEKTGNVKVGITIQIHNSI